MTNGDANPQNLGIEARLDLAKAYSYTLRGVDPDQWKMALQQVEQWVLDGEGAPNTNESTEHTTEQA